MKASEIAQRRKDITALLYKENNLKVATLVSLFDVSDETIRKDLAYLASEGILEKKHGRALLIKEKPLEPVFHRRPKNLAKKETIVTKALELLQSEDLIIGLDQGSTVALLASKIAQLSSRQIFTGSLAAILELAIAHHLLYSFGGQYNAEDMTFRNDTGKEMYPDIQFDVCFFGSSGVKNRNGFCTSSLADAEAKRLMLKKSSKKIVLIDDSKFQTTSLVQVASWSEVDVVISNQGLSPEIANNIRHQTRLILVP
ncbi:DeoR/GlpR family DNA-binding transcription regulator [Enterococcus sp. ALS3]|uniref:DeoR/GlpR family DNA-binding transcription regulator n=1 Tax=Enterococcus alishanensis TaxID=1303817 RepID=A0ABS6TBZ5_9ENTE|nr:DeoR/GlpR family DNA-binding transcription regulator [Enterococcus alishanensis]MBV7390428.1 DeoR/GlpR family DNA-binding transcription regulator [Enterococcus alishanensis]